MSKLRILYANPFGYTQDWTHRMGVMLKLLSRNHKVSYFKKNYTYREGDLEFEKALIKRCETFKPNVIIAHGALIADMLKDYSDRLIIDLGSFTSQEHLIQKHNMNYRTLINLSDAELFDKLKDCPIDEATITRRAKAVLVPGGWEFDLARRILIGSNVIAHDPLYVEETKGLPFNEREDLAIAVAAKWYRFSKNGKFISHYNRYIKDEIQAEDKYLINSVGHGGTYERFLKHDKLMDLFKRVKVVIFPMLSGSVMSQVEALKAGCNVIVQNNHPFRIYNNQELEINMDRDYWSRTHNLIKQAFTQYYPPRPIPTAEQQIEKLEEIIGNYVKNT